MYKTRIKGQGLYQVTSEGYGQPIRLFGQTQEGETPMSLVNVALSSCITMCAQGYFSRYHQKNPLAITVDSQYESDCFQVSLDLAERLSASEKDKLLAYIDQHCRVKQLFHQEVSVVLTVKE